MKDWILEKLAGMFGPKYIGGTTRTLLALLAGYLLKLGLPQAQIDSLLLALDPILTGLIMAGGTWLWSMIQKKRNSD